MIQEKKILLLKQKEKVLVNCNHAEYLKSSIKNVGILCTQVVTKNKNHV
jgi:hypothetical protein